MQFKSFLVNSITYTFGCHVNVSYIADLQDMS